MTKLPVSGRGGGQDQPGGVLLLLARVHQLEDTLDVVAAPLLLLRRDLEVAVRLGHVELVGPVLAAPLHALLHQLREHDDGSDAVLADHAPEVDDGLALGTLRGNEFLVVRVALDKEKQFVIG